MLFCSVATARICIYICTVCVCVLTKELSRFGYMTEAAAAAAASTSAIQTNPINFGCLLRMRYSLHLLQTE